MDVSSTHLDSQPIVRRASPADAPLVIDIIEDSARWLLSRGIEQWKWFLTPAGHELIARRIDQHETYLMITDTAHPNDAIATMTLQWSDTDFWDERGADDTAGYVHGLAVRRSHAGLSLGSRLIDGATQRCIEQGRSRLRLDCMAANAGLRAYYEGLGFTLIEVRPVHDRFLSALYERAIAR